jgi:hypothetical protein
MDLHLSGRAPGTKDKDGARGKREGKGARPCENPKAALRSPFLLI